MMSSLRPAQFTSFNVVQILLSILPLLCGGGLFVAAYDQWRKGEVNEYLGLSSIGLIFFMIGIFLWRWDRVVLDPNKKRWQEYGGFFGLRKKREGSMDDIHLISLRRKITDGIDAPGVHSSPQAWFIYEAIGRKGINLHLGMARDFLKARRIAEDLCKRFHLQLSDYTSDPNRDLSVYELDLNIKQTRKTIEKVIKPDNVRSRGVVEDQRLDLIFSIGNRKKHLKHTFVILVLNIGLALFIFSLVKDPLSGGGLLIFSASMMIFFPSLIMIGSCVYFSGQCRIVADANEFKKFHRWGPIKTTETLAAHEIEDVMPRMMDVAEVDENAITVRADRKIIKFGYQLPPQEKKWIAYEVRRVLSQ